MLRCCVPPPPTLFPRRPGAARPAVTGLTLAGLGLSLGHNCGFPLNPGTAVHHHCYCATLDFYASPGPGASPVQPAGRLGPPHLLRLLVARPRPGGAPGRPGGGESQAVPASLPLCLTLQVLLALVPGVQSVSRDSPGPAAASVPVSWTDLQSVVCTVSQYSPLRARDCEAPGSPAQQR